MNDKKFEINSIVNYLRKSRRDLDREKRTGEDTLSEQKKLMDKVLKEFGTPYDQRFEVGSGDKISSRPVFSEVLNDLREGKYDAIAVKEISRLGRGSMSDMGVIYDIITGRVTGKSIFIITPHKIYDPRNNGDQRQIRFEMFFAREEFEMIRERLTGARYSAAMEGKWMGTVPFGYDRDKKTMKLIPDENKSKIIKLVFQLYLNGINGKDVRDKAIATYLTRNGIKTPKGESRWYANQVKRILTNDVYIGVSKFRTTERMIDGKLRERPSEEHIIVPNAHEPIIDQDIFFNAQEKRNSSSAPRVKLDLPIYELTGILSCGVCGRGMTINKYKRKRQSGDYYATFLRCAHGCATINYNFVLEKMVELMDSLPNINNDTLYSLYESSHVPKDNKGYEEVKRELKYSREEKVKMLEKRLKFIQEKHFNGIYTDEDYLKFKAEIEEEMKGLKKVIEDDVQEEENEDPDLLKTKQEIENFVEAYKYSQTNEDKNKLMRSIFKEVSLVVDKRGTKVRKPEFTLTILLQDGIWKFKELV